jgi:dihydroorotase
MNIDLPEIKKGAKANLTLFDPGKDWTYNQPRSLSTNSPFINQKFKGKVIGVVKGSKCIISN